MKTIGITGGTGFIGRHTCRQLLAAGHSVVVFSRSARADSGGIRFAAWDSEKRSIDGAALTGLDAMIHLAGAGVADKRWTKAYKEEIIRSRVDATLFLHEQLAAYAPNCTAFIGASATGYYGPDREGAALPFTEDAPTYSDFLAQVCARWEAATFSARDRYRTVAIRTGIVLGKDGGAYPRLAGPMVFGVVPILGGSGRQIVSWIHVEDLARLYINAALDAHYEGVYNGVAPQPVSHRTLMMAIASAKGGLKIPVPVPPFVLNMVMGEASAEVLKSCTVSSARVAGKGFAFEYKTIESAVQELTAGVAKS